MTFWDFKPIDFCNTCGVVRHGLFVPTQEPDSICLGGTVDDPWRMSMVSLMKGNTMKHFLGNRNWW